VSRCSLPVLVRAFSLIELLICLSLMGVIGAMTIPRYSGAIERYRADAAARRLAADFALVRSQARLSSRSLTLVFNQSGESYQIAGMESLLHRSNTYLVQFQAEPYFARIVIINFPAQQVTFDQYGTPDRGGNIVVESGNARKTVVLDQTSGKAVVQ
jgi:prepilin-type N-terminal cleavage/methylation domain-containing protein